MRLLRAATLSVPDAAATADRYVRWLDYQTIEQGEVSAQLAASWGAPACAGRRYVIVGPAAKPQVFLRFVEADPVPDYRPLRSFGWAAIEICVQDVLEVNRRMLESPFTIIGPPKELEGLPAIFPMQVRGPDQEIVFLTEIRDDLPEYDLPRAACLIDKLFILVLACEDLGRSMRWFEANLGLTSGREIDLVYSVINDAFGFAPDTAHTLVTMTHGRDVFLELDQYPKSAVARPCRPGALPPGVAMATFLHPDFGACPGDWITAPVARDGVIYAGQPVGVLRAPDGTLVEVMDLPG